MLRTRPSVLTDLNVVTSWVTNQEECDIWSGGSVHFPIEMEQVVAAILWQASHNVAIDQSGKVAAFGQLLVKPHQRLHLARLIVCPEQRGQGLGRMLVEGLVNEAQSQGAHKISLNVHPTNQRAIHLYTELGFLPVENLTENRNGLFTYMEHSGKRP
ncbi:GNAT family N-acetyltransferase [bacterium]|nr:GNAT family N-acetyltransferase [bacterium]